MLRKKLTTLLFASWKNRHSLPAAWLKALLYPPCRWVLSLAVPGNLSKAPASTDCPGCGSARSAAFRRASHLEPIFCCGRTEPTLSLVSTFPPQTVLELKICRTAVRRLRDSHVCVHFYLSFQTHQSFNLLEHVARLNTIPSYMEKF